MHGTMIWGFLHFFLHSRKKVYFKINLQQQRQDDMFKEKSIERKHSRESFIIDDYLKVFTRRFLFGYFVCKYLLFVNNLVKLRNK